MISLLALKQLLEQFMMMLFIPKGVMIYYIYSQDLMGSIRILGESIIMKKRLNLPKKC